MRKPAAKIQQPKTSDLALQPGADWSWQKRRDWYLARLHQQPPVGIDADELQAHFSGMPAHYWQQVDEADLLWSLATINGFLKLVATPGVPATRPHMDFRQVQQAGRTRVMLCTWDRQGLLAKAAAAFSEVRLSILAAEAFTRADDLVLDVFTVMDLDGGGVASEERLKEMLFLLDGALCEAPRFASVWMCSRHKHLASPGQPPPAIRFDNHASDTSTVVHLEAADRLGLLYDILHALAEEGLNVTEAHIKTENNLASDLVHVTDAEGQKLLAPERLKELRSKLNAALASEPT